MHGRKPDGSPATDTPTTPRRVCIRFDKFKAGLNLPAAFELLELPKIYALFKWLKKRPAQNEEAYKILDQFFMEWEQGFKERFEKAALEQWEARGNMIFKVRKVKEAKAALERSGKIVKAYASAKPKETQNIKETNDVSE